MEAAREIEESKEYLYGLETWQWLSKFTLYTVSKEYLYGLETSEVVLSGGVALSSKEYLYGLETYTADMSSMTKDNGLRSTFMV